MELVYRVATPAELEDILAFAEEQLKGAEPDETLRMFQSWHARWRREALEHYLALGWSFLANWRDPSKDGSRRLPIAGFFLAQPLLFVRGMTQSLWIEFLAADSEAARTGLIDVAVRMGRDKHLQRVLFSDAAAAGTDLGAWRHAPVPDTIFEVPTTKT